MNSGKQMLPRIIKIIPIDTELETEKLVSTNSLSEFQKFTSKEPAPGNFSQM